MADYAHLTVKQRVEHMIADAQQQFECRLSINQSNRSAEQAQQFHICHMFLHNFFKHLKPKHLSIDGRTIDWLHLSDPTVNWDLIPQPEKLFLYTKNRTPAQKQFVAGRSVWVAGHEPDKQMTIHVMTKCNCSTHPSPYKPLIRKTFWAIRFFVVNATNLAWSNNQDWDICNTNTCLVSVHILLQLLEPNPS